MEMETADTEAFRAPQIPLGPSAAPPPPQMWAHVGTGPSASLGGGGVYC